MAPARDDESPFALKRRISRLNVTDHNACQHGRVIATHVRGGQVYVTVEFGDGSTRELIVIGDNDERPLTPHFIRARRPCVMEWFRWRKSNDDAFNEAEPAADFLVSVEVRTPERARPERQEQLAWYFAEVLALAIEDVLGGELLAPSVPDAGQADASADVARLDPPSYFGVRVRVLIFTAEDVAWRLVEKLHLLLDSKHALYPDLWHDVFRGRGVKNVVASTFIVEGTIGDERIAKTSIPLRF